MKYSNVSLGKIEAVINKLGGEKGMQDFLANRTKIVYLENQYLLLISKGKTVSISACKGGKTANLAHAQKTFSGLEGFGSENYGIDLPQPATKKIYVDIYEMRHKNGDFKTFFGSLGSNLKSLALESQEQIEKFVVENKQWFRTDGCGIFFLFTEKIYDEERFFIAYVNHNSDGSAYVDTCRFSRDDVWNAGDCSRFVIPITKTLNTEN